MKLAHLIKNVNKGSLIGDVAPGSARCKHSSAAATSSHLSDLLDLGATLSDERAALTGGDDQPHCEGGASGGRAVSR